MLLIFSTSLDGSAAALADRCVARGLPVFRLNTDLLGDYAIRVDASGFTLRDPTGRTATLDGITSALWRKPWIGGDDPSDAFPEPERKWVSEQLRALLRELVALCRARGALRLVEPGADRRLNKLAQMTMAARHLNVPAWEYTFGADPTPGTRAVKALIAEPLHHERMRFLYTSIVEAERLDARYPWLLQTPASGSHDATVVYVAGDCYGFRVRRARQDGPTDWREYINTPQADTWEPLTLPDNVAAGIRALMADARLHYGRLDFIVDDAGHFEVLEVNSNGQFGWLDDPQTGWLHERILDAVFDPRTTIA